MVSWLSALLLITTTNALKTMNALMVLISNHQCCLYFTEAIPLLICKSIPVRHSTCEWCYLHSRVTALASISTYTYSRVLALTFGCFALALASNCNIGLNLYCTYVHPDDIKQAKVPIQVLVNVPYTSESSHSKSRLMSCW